MHLIKKIFIMSFKNIVFIILISPLLALDYSIDISPIIYENCTSCHREGQIGAFLHLTNYEDVFITASGLHMPFQVMKIPGMATPLCRLGRQTAVTVLC